MTDISGEQSLNLNDFLMEIFIGYPIIKYHKLRVK